VSVTYPERLDQMSDRRFIVLLLCALAALLGIGVIVLAALGLQDPTYRDFETGVVTDTSRTLVGLIALGAVLVLGGVGTVVTLVRLQLRTQN
jgi:hypothetical protein